MKLRSLSHTSIHLVAYALVGTIFARPPKEDLEKVHGASVSEQADASLPRMIQSHPEERLPQEKVVFLPIVALRDDEYELVQNLARQSPRGNEIYPWEPAPNFTRPFAKGGSLKRSGSVKTRTLKNQFQKIRFHRKAR